MGIASWFLRNHRTSANPLSRGHRQGRPRRDPRAFFPLLLTLEDRTVPTVTPLLGVAGMNINDGGSFEPPDTIAAAGPSQVVEMVNTAVAVFDKTSGVRLSTQDLNTFFNVGNGDSLSDPYVTYDDIASRFVVAVLEYNASTQKSYYDVGVSNTADATPGFAKYQMDISETVAGQGLLADFPRLGWNHDAYVISFNEFGFTNNQFKHVQILSIEKSGLLNPIGPTLTFHTADRDATNATMVPSEMHGAATNAPMLFTEEGSAANTLRFVAMSTLPATTPTFTELGSIAVSAYSQPPLAPQLGGGNIQTNDSRILSAAWRNNVLVAVQTVGTGGAAHARWYQLSTSGASPTLVQFGEINPGSGKSTYYPAIDIAPDGDLGMTYMESSSSEYMSVYVTGRTASDTPGTVETPVLAHAGTANYSGSRAGDFSGLSADPNPGSRSFWAASEYSPGSPLWGTWIQNFSLGGSWSGYAHDPQHTALAQVASQPLSSVHWSTPVDLAPQYSGSDLLIHYGSPVVTPSNTVIIPVKTGASAGFELQARSGADGTLKWTRVTDYALPPGGYSWTPSYSPTMTPSGRLYFAGLGGTVYFTDSPDAANPTFTQIAFYGSYTHTADTTVFINTPITSDAAGNIYFGFQTSGSAPGGLISGIARIDANGAGSWVSAASAANDGQIIQVVDNAGPALSNDGKTLYFPVSVGNFGSGYLLALDSATLATKGKVVLIDPHTGQAASLPNDGTAAPTVGPDGDVYFGVLENPFASNHDRGWLLHFSADLSTAKTPGAFGWDDTASIVPARLVASYHGTSSYLVMTKYNNYAGEGGNGINKIAILDPNNTEVDPVTGTIVMNEVLTIAGQTPDSQFPNLPGAVREWCINTAVVDPVTKSILANSEDGKLYRWDLTSNTFTEVITLTSGIGEAYTPTFIGQDGTVYAINNATLFAVGAASANTAPTLAAIADQTMGANPATLTLTLNGADPDGDPLTYTAVAEPLLYGLKQTYGLYEDPNGYFTNARGQQEKFLRGKFSANGYANGGGDFWYYILPNGDFYEYTPPYTSPSLVGVLVAHLGTSVYADPSLLWNAQSGTVPVALTVSGNQLTIAPGVGYTGTFVVTASVNDGHGNSVSQLFKVTVTSSNAPPMLAAIADQTMGANPATLTLTLNGSDPDGDPLTYTAASESQPYFLRQTLGVYEDSGGYYTNTRRQNEKYLRAKVSANSYSNGGGDFWYYILPNGDFYEFTPSYSNPNLVGALVGHLGSSVYADPSLLWNAQNVAVPVTLTVSGNQLTIAPGSGYTGTFVVIATVDDGHGNSVSRMFKVTVG